MKTFNRLAALLSSISWCFVSVRAVAPSADLPDPPQCEQLLDCTWSEQGEGRHAEKYESLCQNIPVEAALEATEFTVSAMEAENCPVTIKHNRSSLEGSVIIEMSAQPLLELTPMTGSFVFTSHCCRTHLLSILKWDIVSVSLCISTVCGCLWRLTATLAMGLLVIYFSYGWLMTRCVVAAERVSWCLSSCTSVWITVNSKELEAYQSDQREKEEEETEEEEPPIPPKPVAPDSMFIFKASNP